MPLALAGNERLSLAVLLFILPTFVSLLSFVVRGKVIRFSLLIDDTVLAISMLIMILSIIMTHLNVGLHNLALNKLVNGQVSDDFTRWSILLYASMAFGAILLFTRGRYLYTLAIIACFLVLGDRTQFFFVIISLSILYWHKITFKSLILIIPLIVLGFLGKSIYIYVFTGHFPSLLDYNLDSLSLAHTTQNAFESGRIHYDTRYLRDLPLIMLPINLSENLHYFSEIYKAIFFPHWSKNAGSAGNILVELYWIGGYWSILGFGFIYSVLTQISLIYVKKKVNGIALVLFLVVIWFYVPRNSLFTLVSHAKKFVYLFVVINMFRIAYVSFSRRSEL